MELNISKKITIINEAILECLRISDEKIIVGKLVEIGIEALDADYGYSWFRENNDNQFRWLYKNKKTPYQPDTPRKAGMMAKTFESQNPQFIENVPQSLTVRTDAKKHMQSVVIIPVTYKTTRYGTIVLCYKKRHRFTKEEKSLSEYLGNSAAQTITINRLHVGLQKAKNNLKQTVTLRTSQLTSTNKHLKKEVLNRRRAENKLRESEIRFRSLIENTLDVFTMIGTDGTIIYESTSVKRVLGYELNELLGTNVFKLIHPEDLPGTLQIFQKGLKDSTHSYRAVFRFLHKDGTWRFLESVGQSFLNNPIIGAVIVNSRDITKRKQIEDELNESQMLLAEAQSIAHIGSWEWDIATNELSWSDEMRAIYGVDKNFDTTYANFVSLIDPNDRTLVENKIQAAYNSGNDFEFYHQIICPDGKVKTLHSRGHVTVNAHGKIIKMVGTGQDVTEQKLAEAKLRAYNRKLELTKREIEKEKAKDEALLSSIGQGILASDSRGKIILANPEIEKMFGYKKNEILGKSLFESQHLYDEADNKIEFKDLPAYQIMQRKRRTTKTGIFCIKKKNGQSIPVFITATPIIFKGKVIGVIQVMRDITQEKEIDKTKSELISLASHQLRTPLSAINWYSEALLKGEIGKLEPQQKKYLKEIAHANQKMVELVYDFLNVSRMELGTFSIKLSTINLTDLTESVLKESKPLIEQKKLHISKKYGPGLESIKADRKIVRIILQNLITNAVKYTPKRGNISIHISMEKQRSKQCLYITVKDTGYGIPKNQQSRIFTKLFRADNISKLDTEGTGLGLYIVKSFLKFCKGTVRFVSKENKGTTFFVSLPVD